MSEQASRYASVTVPTRALLGDLAIDVFLRARPGRERSDQRKHVGDGRLGSGERAHCHLDLAVERVDGLVQIDLPPVKASAHDNTAFYETEALRGGWTVRQLERQIESQFFERTALSRNKVGLLQRGMIAKAEEAVTPEQEIKDPFVLEFLGLKDEYSETDLEDALISELETFLLELGGDFAFIGRQRRLRIGSVWYRVDLLFFHRRLRCHAVLRPPRFLSLR